MLKGIIDQTNYKQHSLGEKARRLFVMQENKISIPAFFCVDQSVDQVALETYLKAHFSTQSVFSLRTASNIEDGKETSFAGQFKTYLRVPFEAVWKKLVQLQSLKQEQEAAAYFEARGLKDIAIKQHIIIQEMIEADYAGVVFTANPQGLLSESVIVVGAGTGDLVVEDKTPVSTYYYSTVDDVYYCEGEAHIKIEDKLIKQIITVAKRIEHLFGEYVDIEFALKKDTLFILQARPITTFDLALEETILDNSNIVESYPGITRPATQDFVREIYYKVFKSCLYRLTKDKKSVSKMDETLTHMVEIVNGRVYYCISNWYDVLKFLPFSNKIIPVWQEMLGVENKAVSTHFKGKIGHLTHFKVTCAFFYLLLTNIKKMKNLNRYFEQRLQKEDIQDLRTPSKKLSAEMLLELYQALGEDLASKWDITLVNDMYAFIYTGLLKAHLKKKHRDYETITSSLISGFTELESLKPVKALQALYESAEEGALITQLSQIESKAQADLFFKTCPNRAWITQAEAYIETYGDRSLEELKLESPTFRTSKLLFIKWLVAYKPYAHQSKQEPYKALLKGRTKFYVKHAALGIQNREQSRLNRSRIFGIVREILLRLGEQLMQKGQIKDKEDIFYLYFEEIEAMTKDATYNLKAIVAARKKTYAKYQELPAYTRLIFKGKPFDKAVSTISDCGAFIQEGKLEGVPCSSGTITGEVVRVINPNKAINVENKILVTAMTDPGWVFLIAKAKGIIAEKGSLLSHTAIITRELKKPSIVGVNKALSVLRDGDFISMDGTTGEITILERSKGHMEESI